VLAWLLYPRRLPRYVSRERVARKKHLPSEGCPVLPPLPEDILQEVQRYNEVCLEHFQDLAWTVASTRKISDQDLELPLSGKAFRPGWDPRGTPFIKGSDFEKEFIQQIVRYRARSPFSAISGAGDEFDSPLDLATSARTVMHLDIASFLTVGAPMLGDEEGSLEETNSWILDFMIHGKIKYLWEDNGINATKAWKLINDFKDAVKKTAQALKVFSPADDIVFKTFTALADEMDKYHKGEAGK